MNLYFRQHFSSEFTLMRFLRFPLRHNSLWKTTNLQITSTKVLSAIWNKTTKTLSIENEWQRKRLSLRKAETLLSILFCANSTVATYVFRLQSRADYYKKSKKLDKKQQKPHKLYTYDCNRQKKQRNCVSNKQNWSIINVWTKKQNTPLTNN